MVKKIVKECTLIDYECEDCGECVFSGDNFCSTCGGHLQW